MSWDVVTDQALPSRAVTHFHFIRHGRVDTGGVRMAYGHSDLPLTDEGLRQSREIVDALIEQFEDVDLVLSSDLQRALEIAQPLSERLGVELQIDSALREQSMGDWEATAWSDLTANHIDDVRRFWTEYHSMAPPNGESLEDLSERVLAFFARNQAATAGRRVVVVAHIGVIRAILCKALDLPLDQALRVAPLPSTHTWLMHAESGFVVQCMGERTVSVGTGPAEDARREGRAPQMPQGRPARLALSGSAGVGKTSLGLALSEKLVLRYVPEGMRSRLERGLDLRALQHDELKALILELWKEQVAAEDAATAAGEGFVSDRSPLDYLAFWMAYGFVHDVEASDTLYREVVERIPHYDRIILLPFGVLPLEADGVRTANVWIQRRFQSTVRGLLEEEVGLPRFVQMPSLLSLEKRVDWCVDLLTRSGEYAVRSTR